MCGRFRLRRADQIGQQFGAEYADELELSPRYNIAPSQPVLVVRQEDGRRTASMVRRGLVPFWAKYEVSSLVNSPKNDSVECVAPAG